jgi:hypothetical protein
MCLVDFFIGLAAVGGAAVSDCVVVCAILLFAAGAAMAGAATSIAVAAAAARNVVFMLQSPSRIGGCFNNGQSRAAFHRSHGCERARLQLIYH